MDTGLTQTDIRRITAAIKHFPEIEEAVIFGSRAKGTYKKASDVVHYETLENQRKRSVPLFEKEGLGEICSNKSPSIPLFQRGR